MKICILRRDGENIHNEMMIVISEVIQKYFGEIYGCIDKDKNEFTQMLNFLVSNSVDSSDIINFIIEVSELNPLYTVRILK